jgi:hypothetical protein
MRGVFEQKVREREHKLKQSELELYARHAEMKDLLDRQRAELEERKHALESGATVSGLVQRRSTPGLTLGNRQPRRRAASCVLLARELWSACEVRMRFWGCKCRHIDVPTFYTYVRVVGSVG